LGLGWLGLEEEQEAALVSGKVLYGIR
jgi:hypothetical protein